MSFIQSLDMFFCYITMTHYRLCRVLVELAQLQDEEVGDGTTSVVIIAAELLKVCLNLTKSLY